MESGRDAKEARILQEQFAVTLASIVRLALHVRELTDGETSADLFAKYLRLAEAAENGRLEEMPELARRIVEAAPHHALSYQVQANVNALVSGAPTSTSGARRAPDEVARLRQIVYDSAKAAIGIDPKFDPYAGRALVVDPSVTLAERERLLQKAIEQDPKMTDWLGAYATLLETVGRTEEARIYLERETSANPLNMRPKSESAFLAGWLGDVNQMRRQYDAMRGQQLTDAEIDYVRFWGELWWGDGKIAKQIADDPRASALIWARHNRDSACIRAIVNGRAEGASIAESDLDAACPQGMDIGYALFGHTDAAFRQLEQQVASVGLDAIPFENRYLFVPHMRAVRADPRFMPLAARLGLVDYWVDSGHWPDLCRTEKLPYDCKEATLAARANASKAQATRVDALAR
jgi:tetratricopeptide (TPR) repeat protein